MVSPLSVVYAFHHDNLLTAPKPESSGLKFLSYERLQKKEIAVDMYVLHTIAMTKIAVGLVSNKLVTTFVKKKKIIP